MASQYIHLLRDPDVCGNKGQLICDHCNLQGGDDLETWENFLNGGWISKLPEGPGTYPVIKAKGGNVEIITLTQRNMDSRRDCFRYWSVPIPLKSMKGFNDA